VISSPSRRRRQLTKTKRNSFLLAIRTQTMLPADLRETAICRVAALNRAWYEWEHHAPLLRCEEGVTDSFVQAVFSVAPGSWLSDGEGASMTPGRRHALVLAFTDALTLGPAVPADLFASLRSEFDERAIVELSATIGAYNCVSRFLVALDVGERLGDEGMRVAIEHAGGVEAGSTPAPRTTG
jgi:alkylhydroperoxidase family enzyme